ncbi:MAG: hypothetical protein Q7R52_05460 [archaeon]|nr:hypothetical protein [archaeon]
MGRNGIIKAMFIIEVLGKPAEYLTETLENLIKQIELERGITVIRKKINEPKEIENQKDFYTSFAEIEIETEEMANILTLMFKYMPSHIEIMHPENVFLTNVEWNEVLNELTRRLHNYDEIARVMQIERNVLENKLRAVLEKQEGQTEEIKESEKTKKPKKSKKKD